MVDLAIRHTFLHRLGQVRGAISAPSDRVDQFTVEDEREARCRLVAPLVGHFPQPVTPLTPGVEGLVGETSSEIVTQCDYLAPGLGANAETLDGVPLFRGRAIKLLFGESEEPGSSVDIGEGGHPVVSTEDPLALEANLEAGHLFVGGPGALSSAHGPHHFPLSVPNLQEFDPFAPLEAVTDFDCFDFGGDGDSLSVHVDSPQSRGLAHSLGYPTIVTGRFYSQKHSSQTPNSSERVGVQDYASDYAKYLGIVLQPLLSCRSRSFLRYRSA